MKKGAEEMLSRVLETLEAVGKFEVGHGWKDQVNRSLGKAKGFINHAIERRNLRLDTMFSVLEALGKDPSEFLLEVSVSGQAWNPVAVLCHRGLELDVSLPSVVRRAKDRLVDLEPGLPFRRRPGADLLLDELDDLRFVDPKRTCGLGEHHLERLLEEPCGEGEDLMVPMLARWASARRRCDDPDTALSVLITCLRWAERTTDFELLGDLYRRLAYCYSDHFADYEGCLAIADRALAQFCVSGNDIGIARCLVDRGAWLYYLERYEESLEVHARAAASLPADDVRHLYSCHQYRALSYRQLGARERMQAEIVQAKICDAGPLHTVTIVWLEGSIAAEEGCFEKAERLFLACIRLYFDTSPVNAALVSLELIDLYLAHHRPDLASKAAKAMFPLIEPLEGSPRHPRLFPSSWRKPLGPN